jgi:hypothetical protein
MGRNATESSAVSEARDTRTLVITTCSASKRCRSSTRVEQLRRGSQASVEAAWRTAIAEERDLTPARDLYRGRAFQLALRAVDLLGADLGVISAGLGYVKSQKPVPSYDLTVRLRSPSSVRNRVQGTFDPRSWWSSVANGPFSTPLDRDIKNRGLVLICLSRDYAAMIADNLSAAVRAHFIHLRIFGLSIAGALPDDLKPFVLPYDERLSRIGFPGTRVDFPQRALVHYAQVVAPETGVNLHNERNVVARSLASVPPPPPRRQNRANDDVIKQRIKVLILKLGSSRTRILSHLRRAEGLSCEQRRFVSLYNDVRGETAP